MPYHIRGTRKSHSPPHPCGQQTTVLHPTPILYAGRWYETNSPDACPTFYPFPTPQYPLPFRQGNGAQNHYNQSFPESRCPDCYVETKDWLADSPLVQIWHPTKNLPRVPEDVTVRSNKIFWWQHGEFVWQVSAKDRQKKDGPVLQLS